MNIKTPLGVKAIVLSAIILLLPYNDGVCVENQKVFHLEHYSTEDALVDAALQSTIDALNQLISENDSSADGFYKYFGVEPESIYTKYASKGRSGYLVFMFELLQIDKKGDDRVTLKSTDKVIKINHTGDYTQYACWLTVSGSVFGRAILTIIIETFPESKTCGVKPSSFYVSF